MAPVRKLVGLEGTHLDLQLWRLVCGAQCFFLLYESMIRNVGGLVVHTLIRNFGILNDDL